MKKSVTWGKVIVFLFVAAALALTAAVQAGTSYEYSPGELNGNSGLAIFRAARYVYHNVRCIYIDGISTITLARAEGSRAIVLPGHHVLKLFYTPSAYGTTYLSE